jgi:iron(III) transport system ATP-binding protein
VYREFLGATVRYGVVGAGSAIRVDVPFSSTDRIREVGSPVSVAIDTNRALLLGT